MLGGKCTNALDRRLASQLEGHFFASASHIKGDVRKPKFTFRPKVAASALVLILTCWAVTNGPASAFAAVISTGTVMVGTGAGKVTEFDQTGVNLGQLDTTTASHEETGSAFDSSGNFFTTDFEANQVTKFDPSGVLIGSFGIGGYSADPESILFDATGNVYVGQADGTQHVLEFNSSGTLLNTFAPLPESRGTDWIDLAADNCTLFYTSEGSLIKRFDVCKNMQLTDFNLLPLPGNSAFAHRILLPFQFGAGGVLVADTNAVIRLDASGAQVQTYTLPGTTVATVIFALNLDPDGTSFWTADQTTGQVFKVDIKTGTVLQNWSAAGAANFVDVAGLSVKGELTAPLPPPDCSMAAASAPLLWPPNHKFVSETILGVTAVNGPVTIDITGIHQDESTTAIGSGHTCPDGKGVGTSTAQVRRERTGTADGRVYHIDFTATDQKGQTCMADVTVRVPHDKRHGGGSCIDEGPLFDSTVCP
jgi:streptogramin lyase